MSCTMTLVTHVPVSIIRTPTKKVVRRSVTSTVPSVTWLLLPALWQASTTDVAMADRKMRPTSCTCPTANGRALLMLNMIWWTPLLRKTSFTIWPKTGWKKWSCGFDSQLGSNQCMTPGLEGVGRNTEALAVWVTFLPYKAFRYCAESKMSWSLQECMCWLRMQLQLRSGCMDYIAAIHRLLVLSLQKARCLGAGIY